LELLISVEVSGAPIFSLKNQGCS